MEGCKLRLVNDAFLRMNWRGLFTSWLWRFGDGDSSTVQNPTHIYLTGGTYVVTLTINGLCTHTDTLQAVLSLDVPSNDRAVVLLPNPARGHATLQFGRALQQGGQVQLIAPDGRIVWEAVVPAGSTVQRIPLEQLPTAVYGVRLQHAQGVLTRKLIVGD